MELNSFVNSQANYSWQLYTDSVVGCSNMQARVAVKHKQLVQQLLQLDCNKVYSTFWQLTVKKKI